MTDSRRAPEVGFWEIKNDKRAYRHQLPYRRLLGNCVAGGQLVKNRLSDNVGSVKQLLSTPSPALGEERHFALVEGCLFQPRARL